MKACWTQKDAEYHGRFVDFDPVWVEPKPVSRPHPPVLIGAHSKWAIPRVVDWAEGWLPIVMGPEFDERLAELDRLCEERGRDRAEINVTAIRFAQRPRTTCTPWRRRVSTACCWGCRRRARARCSRCWMDTRSSSRRLPRSDRTRPECGPGEVPEAAAQ